MPRSREREIKERIGVRVRGGEKRRRKNREQEFYTHITSFQFLVVLLD